MKIQWFVPALALAAVVSFAQDFEAGNLTPVEPVSNPCPRYVPGSIIHNPPALYSSQGVLAVRFSYQHRYDREGNELLCFMTPDGMQDPTLHLKAGDHLMITVTNNTPAAPAFMAPIDPPNCGDIQPTMSSVNLHYHGTNTSPACHQDSSIKTVINPGQTFDYDLAIPSDEPSGLYWYHPHIHMLAEHQAQGGATGAIIVEGMEDEKPEVRGLPNRVLIVRDQHVPGNPKPIPLPTPPGNIPSYDLSLNYIPITSPTDPNATNFVPPLLPMKPGRQEFWRICNSTADVILDLQYLFDGVPQPLHIVAIDGVAVNSQDGVQPGGMIDVTHFILPNAARVEFIASAPPPSVHLAQLVTLKINSGPIAIFNDPQRPLLTVQLNDREDDAASVTSGPQSSRDNLQSVAGVAVHIAQRRFSGLRSETIAARHTVFFRQNPPQFFIDVDNKPEHVFDPNGPPDIIATQGTVEEWTIENRTGEHHAFHIHQIHFLVESQNNFEINGDVQSPAVTGQYLDTVQVPAWDLNPSHPYPSVTLLLDFRGNIAGDFLFHCHILSHEDLGMMNIIRVLPSSPSSASLVRRPLLAERSGPLSLSGNAMRAPASVPRAVARNMK